MKLRLLGLAMVVAIGAVSACAAPPRDVVDERDREPTASMKLALQGGNFTGNSVRVCGSRLPPDQKYRCDYQLSDPLQGPDACPCFDFGADGDPIDPSTQEPVLLAGLCPSVDFPQANWNFTYTIYSAPNCGGTILNTPGNNFVCYDADDLADLENPNQSTEALAIGENTNHILCLSETSRKTFEFQSCGRLTTPTDPAGTTRYECGCVPAPPPGACSCADAGTSLTAADLPSGCAFDATNCNIVCTRPVVANQEQGVEAP